MSQTCGRTESKQGYNKKIKIKIANTIYTCDLVGSHRFCEFRLCSKNENFSGKLRFSEKIRPTQMENLKRKWKNEGTEQGREQRRRREEENGREYK